MANLYLAIVLAPLAAAILAGLFGKQIGRAGAHWVTIIGVAVSFVLSLVVLAASLVPARRATLIDPARTMRTD